DRLAIHRDVAEAVDLMLRGLVPSTEVRERRAGGEVAITQPLGPQRVSFGSDRKEAAINNRSHPHAGKGKLLRIYPYAISRERLERGIGMLCVQLLVTNGLEEADVAVHSQCHAQRPRQNG